MGTNALDSRRIPSQQSLLRVSIMVLMAVAGLVCGADTGSEERQPAATAEAPPGFVFVLFPAAEFYPQYIADPLRPQGALIFGSKTTTDIPDSGKSFYLLRLGGRFPIARWHRADDPEQGWQIDFEGGFFGQFDVDHSLDNTGWDGLYGLTLVYRGDGPLRYCVGTRHDSAHLGDEYAERTGQQRTDYTREELIVAVSWQLDRQWRTYAEAGYALGVDGAQEPLRLQLGAERLSSRSFFSGRFGWYAAIDMTLFEELDWQINTTAQLGLFHPTGRGTSRYRLAFELGSGRSVLGELSAYDESYLAVGWYFDF
jgi:hypothetical protein